MQDAELAAVYLNLVKGFEPSRRVMAHAARVVVHNQFERGQPRPQRQNLIDLLLVFRHHHAGFGMVEHIGHFSRNRVLINRHSNAAKALRRQLRPVKPRAVVADHRQLVAAPKSTGGKPKRKVADLAVVFSPGKGLPDAQRFFADRRPGGHCRRVAAQQARQCFGFGAGGSAVAAHSAASLARCAPPPR